MFALFSKIVIVSLFGAAVEAMPEQAVVLIIGIGVAILAVIGRRFGQNGQVERGEQRSRA